MVLELNKRIRRPEEDDGFLKELTVSGDMAKDGVFKTMAEALVYAAALAYQRDLPRRSFEKTAEPIPAVIFLNSQYDGFINMLAAEVTKDYQVLLPERSDERVRIFEELAAAGIALLRQSLERDSRRLKVDVIRDLTLEAYRIATVDHDADFDELLNELKE